MRLRIEVNGESLGLLEGTDELFYITKQINDLHNLQNRQADFTRDISIPATPDNLRILDLVNNEKAGNKSFLCNIYIDHILIIPSGRLLILEYQSLQLSGIIFSGNFDLFQSIPDESIKELNFSSYNFPYTQTDLAALNTTTEGPLLSAIEWNDFDSFNNGNAVPVQLQEYDEISHYGFSMHCKTILKSIINTAGFELDDSLLSSNADYNDLVLACPVDLPVLASPSIFANWGITPAWTYDQTYLGLAANIPFNTIVEDLDNLWDNVNKYYVVGQSGNYQARIDFDIDFINILNRGPCIIRLELNGGLMSQTQLPATGNYASFLLASADMVPGDQVQATIQCQYQNNSQFDQATVNVGSTIQLKENINDPTGTLVVSDWLPDIKQETFLKDILKIFNASIDSSEFSKSAKIIPLNDFLNQTPVELTDNLDISQPISEELTLRGYYQNSILTYSNDSDVTRSNASTAEYFGGFEDLEPTGTILQLSFSGSDQGQDNIGPLTSINTPYFKGSYRSASGWNVGSGSNTFTFDQETTLYPGEFIVYGTRIERVRTVNTTLNGGTFFNNYHTSAASVDIQILTFSETQDLTPRIGKVDRIGSSNTRKLTSNTYGLQAPVITNVAVYNTEFLDFNYIKETYYRTLFDSLQVSKILICWMVFSSVEYAALDLSKPVYINESRFNGLFYINKIEQWKINVPCRVELIRINDALFGAVSR